MVHVADSIYSLLGLTRPIQLADVDAAIAGLGLSNGVPVFSEDGMECLKHCLMSHDIGDIEVYQIAHNCTSWRYVGVQEGINTAAEVCFCPNDGINHSQFPPTNAEILVVKAWSAGLIDLTTQKLGTIIIQKYANHKTADQKTFSSLLSLIDAGFTYNTGSIYQSPITAAIRVDILQAFDEKRFSNQFSDLLQDALGQTVAKWRFLQFYRILEQGYISQILDQIVQGFPASPKAALKMAQESLESEPSQLKSLIESTGIVTEFEVITDIFEQMKTNHNRFAWAVSNKLAKRASGIGKFRKGADVVYAIRCAIAHAGSTDIYYENYRDSDDLIKAVLPMVEESVLRFLCISIML